MTYYVDFDNCLYDTPKLTKAMLCAITNSIMKKTKANKQEIYLECNSMFNREHIYDIYELINYFSEKYGLNFEDVKSDVDKVIFDGKGRVFEDSSKFLEDIKKNGHNLVMLTHSTNEEFQLKKIAGSGLTKYFDTLCITDKNKGEIAKNLNLNDKSDYVFIDDSPTELSSLYENGAQNLIRLKRPDGKYSEKPLPDSLASALKKDPSIMRNCDSLANIYISPVKKKLNLV